MKRHQHPRRHLHPRWFEDTDVRWCPWCRSRANNAAARQALAAIQRKRRAWVVEAMRDEPALPCRDAAGISCWVFTRANYRREPPRIETPGEAACAAWDGIR